MLYILALIIVLYISSYVLFRKNQTFLQIRKWVDITTAVVTSVLVIAWVEIFHYSFYFLIYFFVSLAIIIGLVIRLRRVEMKKKKAENLIQVLKDEEELLEEELQNEKNINL